MKYTLALAAILLVTCCVARADSLGYVPVSFVVFNNGVPIEPPFIVAAPPPPPLPYVPVTFVVFGGPGTVTFTVDPPRAPVSTPEPSTLVLVGVGLVLLCVLDIPIIALWHKFVMAGQGR